MSSGLQYFIPANQQPVQAVRFDGTNRSQIEQWIQAEGLELAGNVELAWVDHHWAVWDPAHGRLVYWWGEMDFRTAHQPITAKQAEAINDAAS